MDIQNIYKYSILSTLSYVNWSGAARAGDTNALISDANNAPRIPGIANDSDGSNTLGEKIFIDGWRVGSFYPNDSAGFKASLFTNSGTNEKVLAITGTTRNLD